MVVKGEAENKTPLRTLPPATAHENDVIASRMSIIQQNLQKKREPPRFAGGIWDIDDSMDTSESAHVANRESLKRQLKTILQSENPYFEIDDRMDTIEASNSENLSFLSPSYLEVPGGEMDITTVAKIPEVVKKEPENVKKKSIDEISLERSKRCRTSSKTEVYPLQISFEVESEFSQAVMSKASPVEGPNAEPIVSEVDNNLLPQNLDVNSPTTSKESQVDIKDDSMQVYGVGLKTEAQNFYQKEIESLQKVVLILKSHNSDEKEHSEEVGQLQKICRVLENLGNASHRASNRSLDDNKSVARGDLAGEAAFILNGVHHNEHQSTELTNPKNDNLQPVVNEDVGSIIQDPCGSASHSVDSNKKSEVGSDNQWLQQIKDGTLPWKPIGRPPPATAFGIGPNALNSPKLEPSVSSKNGALPQAEEKSNPEQSFGRVMETDDIFEMLKNASRGSPPPMAAFGKSPTTSPSRTISKSSSMTQDDLVAVFDKVSKGLQMSAAAIEAGKIPSKEKIKEKGHQDEQVDEVPKVKPDVNLPKHTSVSTSRSVLELNSVKSLPSFKAKTAQSPYNLRSSMKTPDSSFYQSKEPKSPDLLKDNVTMVKEAVPSPSPKYIPPHLRSKSSSSSDEASRSRQGSQGFRPEVKTPQNHARSQSKTRERSFPYQAQEQKATVIKYPVKSNFSMKTEVSNQQTQDFKTAALSNWRKDKSPPKQNDLSSGSKQGAVEDRCTKPPPNVEKDLNLNVKTDNSSSRSNPSVFSDSSKRNPPAKVNERRHPSNDRKISNHDLRKERSAYGIQHSENGMVSLKIFDEKNALVDERTLPLSQLAQIIKNFPSLSDVIPSTGEKDRELLISGNAVKVFLGCVFPTSTLSIPGWEVALEAYYLAKKYGIEKLQDYCKDYFNFQDIHSSQVESIVQTARKFEITDALKHSAMFAEVPKQSIPDPTRPLTIKEQKCTVSCTLYVDPIEFPVPLYYVKETGLGSTIEADIHNDITFEAKSGTFCLTGLQIKLEAETKDFRKEVSILCDVYKNNRKMFDLKREKRLSTLLIIDFKQRLLVEPGESVSISVLMEDACMRMCHCLVKEKEFGRCEGGGRFEVTFESDRKSEAKRPLFFVEKLLYKFEGWKN